MQELVWARRRGWWYEEEWERCGGRHGEDIWARGEGSEVNNAKVLGLGLRRFGGGGVTSGEHVGGEANETGEDGEGGDDSVSVASCCSLEAAFRAAARWVGRIL